MGVDTLSCEKLSHDIEAIHGTFGTISNDLSRKECISQLLIFKEKVSKLFDFIENISITREDEDIDKTMNQEDQIILANLNRKYYTVDALDLSHHVKSLATWVTTFTELSKEHLEAAKKLPRLRELYLRSFFVYKFNSKSLKTLFINSSEFSEDFDFCDFPNLQTISMINNTKLPDFRRLLELKQLKRLRINSLSFTDEEKEVFKKLQQSGVKTEIIYSSK